MSWKIWVRFLIFSADRAHDQAAEITFHLVQLWKCGTHAQIVGVPGINARDKRVDRLVEKLGVQSA